jgi:hypothetical protein
VKLRPVLLSVALTVLLGAAVAIPAYLVARHDTPTAMDLPRVSGIPADVPTSLANLMSLSALPRTPAPGFTLTDQHGRERYLAMPVADHTSSGTAYLPASQLASWGHGIALLARDLLS